MLLPRNNKVLSVNLNKVGTSNLVGCVCIVVCTRVLKYCAWFESNVEESRGLNDHTELGWANKSICIIARSFLLQDLGMECWAFSLTCSALLE